ncbi:hypothetical protein PR048_013001 [Dryococelus australis]|uniref:Uncharacterized protein n=1 Tax=Dryococelus australis TaxID=614101 RepID=A0ABQ9HQZ0_9NEOP|nr:hypothetical protein PR048_013001 [Dryococelus australis]
MLTGYLTACVFVWFRLSGQHVAPQNDATASGEYGNAVQVEPEKVDFLKEAAKLKKVETLKTEENLERKKEPSLNKDEKPIDDSLPSRKDNRTKRSDENKGTPNTTEHKTTDKNKTTKQKLDVSEPDNSKPSVKTAESKPPVIHEPLPKKSKETTPLLKETDEKQTDRIQHTRKISDVKQTDDIKPPVKNKEDKQNELYVGPLTNNLEGKKKGIKVDEQKTPALRPTEPKEALYLVQDLKASQELTLNTSTKNRKNDTVIILLASVSIRTCQQIGAHDQQTIGTLLANQCLVIYSLAGSPDKGKLSVVWSSQSDTVPVPRASHSQSEHKDAHIEGNTTPFRLCVIIYSVLWACSRALRVHDPRLLAEQEIQDTEAVKERGVQAKYAQYRCLMSEQNILIDVRDRGGVVVRLHASHLGEPRSIPYDAVPGFSHCESCRTLPLVGGGFFFRGSPVSPVLAFRRCSILTTLQPQRLSRLKTLMLRVTQEKEVKVSERKMSAQQVRKYDPLAFIPSSPEESDEEETKRDESSMPSQQHKPTITEEKKVTMEMKSESRRTSIVQVGDKIVKDEEKVVQQRRASTQKVEEQVSTQAERRTSTIKQAAVEEKKEEERRSSLKKTEPPKLGGPVARGRGPVLTAVSKLKTP